MKLNWNLVLFVNTGYIAPDETMSLEYIPGADYIDFGVCLSGQMQVNIDGINNTFITKKDRISIGISEKYFEYIVKPFTQVEASPTRSFDGSGLGLAVCSELLNAMDSRLEIHSEEGSGSTFGFNLCLAANSSEYSEGKETAIDSHRILLIDDIEANLKIVGGLLETLNQKVVYARGSRQGIEKSRLDDFDAVIVDLHMPEMDGMETIREIRKKHPEAAAFLMTADTRKEVFTEYRKAGFTGFIAKPVDISRLKEALGKIRSDNTAANINIEVGNDCEEIVDKEFILELKNDLGDEVFIDVIKSCVASLGNEADRLSEPGSIDDRKDIIHQLKGVAGNYRLTRLRKVLEGYETDIPAFDSNQLAEILKESIKTLNESFF